MPKKSSDPFIVALCPTYKRPEMLSNVLACWMRQEYPRDRRLLVICDDAGQFNPVTRARQRWMLTTPEQRYPTVPDKYNGMAKPFLPIADILLPFEDDDVYLPWHLSSIAAEWTGGAEYFVSENVASNHGLQIGETQIEGAAGRFHASWAFAKTLFERVGGYPTTAPGERMRLDFDQRMDRLCRTRADAVNHYGDPANPSYVYRWQSAAWNGSQAGEDGFAEFYESLARLPSPWVGELVPRMDAETRLIFQRRGLATPAAG